jgi:hypothetical protein
MHVDHLAVLATGVDRNGILIAYTEVLSGCVDHAELAVTTFVVPLYDEIIFP